MKPVGIKTAAQAVGLSQYSLRVGAKRGKYPHLFVGGRYMFYVEQLEETLHNESLHNQQVKQAECKAVWR